MTPERDGGTGRRSGEREERTADRRSDQPRVPTYDPVRTLQRLIGNRALAGLAADRGAAPEGIPHSYAPLDRPSTPRSRDGTPLPAAAMPDAVHRFGAAAQIARIHTGEIADRAATLARADALTVGRDIYLPHTTVTAPAVQKRAVLLHEVAHVAQYLVDGAVGPAARLERQAESAATASSLAPTLRPGDAHRSPRANRVPLRSPVQVLRRPARGRKGQLAGTSAGTHRLTVFVDHDGGQVVVETPSGTVTGALAHNGRPDPGVHQVSVVDGTRTTTPRITSGTANADGMIVTWGRPIADELKGVRNYTITFVHGLHSVGAVNREIDKLPAHIQSFLTSGHGKRSTLADWRRNLEVGRRLEAAGVTADELFTYRQGIRSGFDAIGGYEQGVEQFLTQRTASQLDRAVRVGQLEESHDRLRGANAEDLKQLYLKYRTYKALQRLQGASVLGMDTNTGGMTDALLEELNRKLPTHGFADTDAFGTHVDDVVALFRDEALAVTRDVLRRYERILKELQPKYKNWDDAASSALLRSLGGIRTQAQAGYQRADDLESDAALATLRWAGAAANPLAMSLGGGGDLVEHLRKEPARLRGDAAKERTAADRLVTDTTRLEIVGWQDFPRERLLRKRSAAGVRVLIGTYIAEHRYQIAQARRILADDPDRVFALDEVIDATRSKLGMSEGTLAHLVIEHHARDLESDETAKAIALAIVSIALAVVSFGVGGAAGVALAGASFGLSAYDAFNEISKYSEEVALYAAQLIDEEPSAAWAVIAVLGAIADVGAVGKAVGAIDEVADAVVPAAKTLNETGDLATFEQALMGIRALDDTARARVLRAAKLELRAREAWRTARARILGPVAAFIEPITPVARMAVHLTYPAYLTIRRGIIGFKNFLRTREAISLIANATELSAEQLRNVRGAYRLASKHARKIALRGKQLGMPDHEIEQYMLLWNRTPDLPVDDVLRQMDASMNVTAIPRRALTADNLKSVLPGVRIDGRTSLRHAAIDVLNALPVAERNEIVTALRRLEPSAAGEQLTKLGRQDPATLSDALKRRSTDVGDEIPTGDPVMNTAGQVMFGTVDDAGLDDLLDVVQTTTRRVDNVKVQAGRAALRARMDVPAWSSGGDWNAHHIYPVEVQDHPVFLVLKETTEGWDHHNPVINGIALPTTVDAAKRANRPMHQVTKKMLSPDADATTVRVLRGHPNYNRRARQLLDGMLHLLDRPDALRRAVLEARLKLLKQIGTSTLHKDGYRILW